ncbi:MAG: GNAT family N-acetyltransferase [Myxococcota bacterium]|nr:GNAT family N-acetyltransferase [Myxococcota bacterium]MEC9440295.1 GNAT family N-acetyltransferase [Myxococcota bacterium]
MSATPRNYKIEIHEGIRRIDGAKWNALVEGESPFLEYGFLSLLEETGCTGEESGWFPMIFVATESDGDGDGEDATTKSEDRPYLGALPFYIKTNSAGEFVFDWGWADAAYRAGIRYYPKGVVAVPFTPVTGARILTASELEEAERSALGSALIQTAMGFAKQAGLSSVHFNFIPEHETGLFKELGLPLRYGMQYHWYNGRERGMASPYEDFDDYLSRFRSKKRANIRRERRKLEEEGVTSRVLTGDMIDEAIMADMFEYYRDTVQKFFYGKQYLTEEFFLALPDVMRDRLHFVIMSRDGEDFGGTFNLYKNDRLYGRYWGATAEVQFAHFEACMYTPIEWAIEHGVKVFEPGAGGEHKYDRGFEPTHTYSAHYLVDERLDEAIRGVLAQERASRDLQIEHLSKENPFKDT